MFLDHWNDGINEGSAELNSFCMVYNRLFNKRIMRESVAVTCLAFILDKQILLSSLN